MITLLKDQLEGLMRVPCRHKSVAIRFTSPKQIGFSTSQKEVTHEQGPALDKCSNPDNIRACELMFGIADGEGTSSP